MLDFHDTLGDYDQYDFSNGLVTKSWPMVVACTGLEFPPTTAREGPPFAASQLDLRIEVNGRPLTTAIEPWFNVSRLRSLNLWFMGEFSSGHVRTLLDIASPFVTSLVLDGDEAVPEWEECLTFPNLQIFRYRQSETSPLGTFVRSFQAPKLRSLHLPLNFDQGAISVANLTASFPQLERMGIDLQIWKGPHETVDPLSRWSPILEYTKSLEQSGIQPEMHATVQSHLSEAVPIMRWLSNLPVVDISIERHDVSVQEPWAPPSASALSFPLLRKYTIITQSSTAAVAPRPSLEGLWSMKAPRLEKLCLRCNGEEDAATWKDLCKLLRSHRLKSLRSLDWRSEEMTVPQDVDRKIRQACLEAGVDWQVGNLWEDREGLSLMEYAWTGM